MNKVPINMYLSYYGKETIDLDTHGKSSGRSGNYSTNYQIAGREKMTPDEVRLLDNNYALCFIRGERPIKDYKYDILKHPNIALTTDGGEKPYIHGKTDKASASIIVLDENNGEEIVTNFEENELLENYELLSEEELLIKKFKMLSEHTEDAEVKAKSEMNISDAFKRALPQDFVKFGLIPEFIGRLPVVVTLDNLDEDAFVHILTEPKNALTKQYEYLFALDDVILEFKEEALRAIARKAMERETGARGLRSIVEEFINPIMYEIPTQTNVERCIITEDVVNGKAAPEYVYNENRKPLQRMRKRKSSRGNSGVSA